MMIFHYCNKYLEKVQPEFDKVVRNRINNLSRRHNLRGVSGVFSYFGVIVLQTSTPSNMRTIIQEKKVKVANQELSVFFVQDIVKPDDLSSYTDVRNGRWITYNPVIESDEQEFIKDFIEKNIAFSEKQPIPKRLLKWLPEFKIQIRYDVYETKEWVSFASGNSMSESMGHEILAFKILLKSIVKDTHDNEYFILKEGYNFQLISKKLSQDIGIIYTRIEIESRVIFLLHSGAHLPRQEEYWNKFIINLTEKEFKYEKIDDINKAAVRAYPSWVLNDNDMWQNIQKNSETGNLALLTEQTDFLKNFKFPAYLNGQAGSGKSTMLYYLFSNIYYYKCLGEIEGNIVFISENANLLERTKQSIRDLLQHNPEFRLTADHIINVDRYFYTLKEFLLSFLEEENDRFLFPSEKYLDFSLFKIKYENNLYINKYIKSKFTAEFIWFVITTYIKGYHADSNITSQNYDDKMPRDDKDLLSKEDLKEIEKHVLPFYERLIDRENYWDKLKIIKYIQSEVGITEGKFEVVFCDEAQDFSLVELRFILSLSEYLQYLPYSNDLANWGVPVVLAGDPFQTVSPTGFRKENVKDLFFRELNANLKENEYKPKYNYRSSQVIVNLANAVQYWRKEHFMERIEQAQRTKYINHDSYYNVFISYEDLSKNEAHYINELEHKTIIVPVNTDEKERYLESDTFLNNFVSHYSIEGYNGNRNFDLIKSAVEAKGIDYPQVILHGFGAYYLQNFVENEKISTNYDKRFFFNKLYVAVTRAQDELIIIDSKESLDIFWQPLLNQFAQSDWKKDSEVTSEEINKTICAIDGNTYTIKKGTPEMALNNARRDKEQAQFENNPTLMRMAAAQFLKLGNKKEYHLCKAEEYRLEGNFIKAAEHFRDKEVGRDGIDLAANLFWEEKMLNEFRVLPISTINPLQKLRIIVFDLIEVGKLSQDDTRELEKKSTELTELLRNLSWRGEVIEKLITFSRVVTDKELQLTLISLFKTIEIWATKDLLYEIGRLQFEVGRFSESIETLLRSNIEDIENDELYINAQIEKARQGQQYDILVEWLGHSVLKNIGDLGQAKEIVEIYEQHHLKIDNSNNFYAHLFNYVAHLLQKPNSDSLILLAKRAESEFSNKKETLDYVYTTLLHSGRLSDKIFNFTLGRWAKSKHLKKESISNINTEYKIIAEKCNKSFEPFNAADLETILIQPEYINPPLSDHFESITIHSFRKFENLTIENLGVFNLVVGDNNIGKTSLLESFLFTPDPKLYLERLAFAYIERKNIQPNKKDINGVTQIYYSIDQEFIGDFNNNKNPHLDIRFTFRKGRDSWKYGLTQNETSVESEDFQYLRFADDESRFLQNILFTDSVKQPFMPYGKGFGTDLAAAFNDNIASNPKIEKDFISKIELFIPNIDRLKVDTRRGEIDILQIGAEEYISLHQFGEGANKIFRILLLLTIHKGKRLMIDEIDAGIHYSRFKEFWKIILEASHKNNTQIIATTHNEECIAYYTEALVELGEQYKSKARVIQCKLVADQLLVRSYDFENFDYALQKGIELRGEVVSI